MKELCRRLGHDWRQVGSKHSATGRYYPSIYIACRTCGLVLGPNDREPKR